MLFKHWTGRWKQRHRRIPAMCTPPSSVNYYSHRIDSLKTLPGWGLLPH